ncbi:MAG: hypothetical protein K0U47_06480 [Epsilonproteobacteria bacterium]|nr:hypothetical protein [Campylobacterota bacterium]
MLGSKKIKLIGIVGTTAIVLSSYILHAQTYYSALHPEIVTPKNPDPIQVKKPIEQISVTAEINKTKETQVIKLVSIKQPLEDIKEEYNETVKEIKEPSLVKLIKEHKYIRFDTQGNIAQTSKLFLTSIAPKLRKQENQYLEIEGYSPTLKAAQKKSNIVAKKVKNLLKENGTTIEIKTVGYADQYPIYENPKENRNLRVELKLRRR